MKNIIKYSYFYNPVNRTIHYLIKKEKKIALKRKLSQILNPKCLYFPFARSWLLRFSTEISKQLKITFKKCDKYFQFLAFK